MANKKWYQKKRVFIPFSVAMGFASGVWLGDYLSKKIDNEFSPDYYHKKESPIFIKK